MTTYDLGSQVIPGGWGWKADHEGDLIKGGLFQRPPDVWDPELRPWSEWHRVNTCISVQAPHVSICKVEFDNYGDAVAMAAANQYKRGDFFTVCSCIATRGHDDFVENDNYYSGVVYNNRVDGCSTFYSSRSPSATPPDGRENLVIIQKNLVRLAPFYNSYNVPKYGHDRHGPFFKMGPWAPMLDVIDNVFAASEKGFEGVSLDLPASAREVRGNTLLWLGEGAWPADSLKRWLAKDPETKFYAGAPAQAIWTNYKTNWRAS